MSEIRKLLANYIKQNKKIESYLGSIDSLKVIGAGGNGVVYTGKLNDSDVAIKFFVEKGETKLTRFKAEFFNVQMLPPNTKTVKLLNYEELNISEEDKKTIIPYILMKKYDGSLKEYRKKGGFDEDLFYMFFNFLIEGLEFIHSEGIIHRDIKPENILVINDDEFVFTDFGIAYYNPDMFALKAQTKECDRMGNYEFSAPEQATKGIEPAFTMDIYALGQLLQWYCYENTHRGTGRKSITHLISGDRGEIIDNIINKCLSNDATKRFQTINEIQTYFKSEIDRKKKPDAFDEMRKFSRVLRKISLSNYRKPYYINQPEEIEALVSYLNEENFKQNLEFNTGGGNSTFNSISYLGDKRVLIGFREFKLNGVWVYCNDNLYDDILLLDCIKYGLNDNIENQPIPMSYLTSEHFDGVFEVPTYSLESGFVKIDNKVYGINDFKIEELFPNYSYRYVAIGTNYHSVILSKSDSILDKIKDSTLNYQDIINLIGQIRENKHKEVFYRL